MQGKAAPPAYDGSLEAKEITPDKRADSVNEKWPENLACCHHSHSKYGLETQLKSLFYLFVRLYAILCTVHGH